MLVELSKEMNGGIQKFHVVQMRVSCVCLQTAIDSQIKSLQICAVSERLTPCQRRTIQVSLHYKS